MDHKAGDERVKAVMDLVPSAMFHFAFPATNPILAPGPRRAVSASSIRSLVRLLGPGARGSMVLVLGAFFDDSGIHDSSSLVALGGLLGTEQQWDEFASAWSKLLNRPLPGKPGLAQFHLAACRAGTGEFLDYSLSERDHITYLFRQVILNVGLVTLAAAVNKVAWDELITGELRSKIGEPEELCFVKCMDSVLSVIRSRKPGEQVIVIFDQGTRKTLDVWARCYLDLPEKYPEIFSISFAPVSKEVALQGADMIATETYQFGQEWMKDREKTKANPHFQDFIKRDLSGGLILDRDHIEEIVERFRRAQKLST